MIEDRSFLRLLIWVCALVHIRAQGPGRCLKLDGCVVTAYNAVLY